jgi:hypothetical protein
MQTPFPISDDQSIASAKGRFGHPIPVYDDGFGPLFIHRDSMGISGIVRAMTWEDAYSICEDEFFPEASKTMEELVKEYGFKREHVKVIRTIEGVEREDLPSDYPRTVRPAPDGRASWDFVRWETRETPDAEAWADNELFQEAFGFRPNGRNSKDKIGHGIYAKDLNGDRLEPLTVELAASLELTLQIETNS